MAAMAAEMIADGVLKRGAASSFPHGSVGHKHGISSVAVVGMGGWRTIFHCLLTLAMGHLIG
ncbi:MAG: hypothetical protein BRC35_15025 [Cyanobacteria bacterium QH_10_48_56]|nr:MAG: hypothetical protein BRC35_15025 [Cyanobacteria bacterium QH_10_48_56]